MGYSSGGGLQEQNDEAQARTGEQLLPDLDLEFC
jgi:hypothetical protein